MLWEDVSYWLLQKSKKKYYRDPVVRYGYARGMEPVLYVSRILDRFEHYKEFVPADDSVETTVAGPLPRSAGPPSRSVGAAAP